MGLMASPQKRDRRMEGEMRLIQNPKSKIQNSYAKTRNMSQERKKFVMKIARRAVTTAVVVDCPTPLAPPVVVNPQLEPMMAINAPKMPPLIMPLIISQGTRKSRAESRKMR